MANKEFSEKSRLGNSGFGKRDGTHLHFVMHRTRSNKSMVTP